MQTRRIDITWAGACKWATRDGGDAISVVEAASGAMLAMILDVQGSGAGAGALARSLATLAGQLAGEGLDARSVATALNRSLWTRRSGRVLADIAVIVAPTTGPVEIARYGAIAVALHPEDGRRPAARVVAAGGVVDSSPAFDRVSLGANALVVCSDGVSDSDEQLARLIDVEVGRPPGASEIVANALARDRGRAKNDMSVIVVRRIGSDRPEPISVEGRMTVNRRVVAGTEEQAQHD